MDKLFFDSDKKEAFAEATSSDCSSALLTSLILICISLFFFNLSFSMKQETVGEVGGLEDALLTLADSLEKNDTICAFLGIEDELFSENEIY